VPERIPDEKAHVRHVIIAAVVGVLGTALFAAGLWIALSPDDGPAKQTEIEPAEPTVPSLITTDVSTIASSTAPGSVLGTGTGGGTGAVSGTATVTTPSGEKVVRAARIAFRLGATLYVANEDGIAASPINRSDDGP